MQIKQFGCESQNVVAWDENVCIRNAFVSTLNLGADPHKESLNINAHNCISCPIFMGV